jgi:precorrin-3B synthase
MASGDGLVVRVRPPLGELTAEQARGLAGAATRFGNGLIELTNRANLQLRGVTETTHGFLLDTLAELGLLDADPRIEGRRNIVLNPFRGTEDHNEQTRIGMQLAASLATSDLDELPSKFGFIIDTGPNRCLAHISGDIRIEAAGAQLIVRADGCATGRFVRDAEEAVSLTLDLARWFIATGGVGPDGRGRMARHLAGEPVLPEKLAGNIKPNEGSFVPRPGPISSGLLVAAGFGQLAPDDLLALAAAARCPIRITPWRMFFLPGVTDAAVIREYNSLIPNPDDPLLRVHACIGAPGCTQSSVETRKLARDLAERLHASTTLHVSGCVKGCVYPTTCDLTLVGKEGLFDLVIRGSPWDDPNRCALLPADLPDIIGG